MKNVDNYGEAYATVLIIFSISLVIYFLVTSPIILLKVLMHIVVVAVLIAFFASMSSYK